MGGHLPGATIKPQVRLPKDPAGCWEWLGHVCPKTGYGKKQWHGITFLAHRWLWMQLFGPIGDGVPLQNTCDNKACVNPHHWHVSTPAAINRGSVRTILTSGDVIEIKSVPAKDRATRQQRGDLARSFAARFNVTPQLICDIWAGRAWARPRKIRNRRTHDHPEASLQ